MYRCQICCKTTPPKTPAYKITIETRAIGYSKRSRANACYKRYRDHGELRTKFTHTDDKGGSGYECKREVMVCPECAAAWKEGMLREARLE